MANDCEVKDIPELSEYALELLCRDEEFILYRGRHRSHSDLQSVLIRALSSTHPAPETLKKLEHESSIGVDLDSGWAVRPIAFSQQSAQPVLLLEDPGGEPLNRLIEGAMGMPQFLRISTGIAAALNQLHKRGLIHKEVKPSNILVNSASGQVWLMGFGIASPFPRERQSPEPPELIAGTLAYMAPEQTGRMNRSIDSRSDLYALGVTLYEMLTGCLPFTASDPMEWVHCHIARQPVPPEERLKNLPGSVSEIVMKLLAKTADERYQTAAGVESDLRRCLAEWETRGHIDEFPLGEHDTPDRLLIPEKLYGRASEVDTLLASFDRVVAGNRPELVLVSGYSGIGKSSVVNELHKVLVPPRGLFASGKFDQYKRDIPYATLAQALQSLIRPLLSKSETQLSKWRDNFRQALDPNGALMVNLVPELRFIIGEQPQIPDLPQQDAKARFQLVFRRFIGVFARPEHPLALFLDDLQWLDAATLDLLEDLLTQPDVQHLMLIGAYRNNEVSPTHPLMRKLAAIRQNGAIVQEIILEPLASGDLRSLIADSLHCGPERAAPLGQLIHDKTGGNPFFVIQFISALEEEGLLAFDHDAGRWSWDLNRIHSKGYADNVVDLMVEKLIRLPVETQNALQDLACLGNMAEVTKLSISHGTSEEELHEDLWQAVRQQLIVCLEGSYKFAHDRVQEAAYSLIPQDLRPEAHLRIGRLLTAHTPPEKLEEAIFEIVNQSNRGTALINSQEEREQLAHLNLIAGKRAKASSAYRSALNYLTAGAALLADDCWERQHELTFALELNRGECEFLAGDPPAAAERLTALSSRVANAIERATVARLRVDVHTALDQSDRAVEVCLNYLRHLGVEWSPHPRADEARREYDRIWSQLGSREIEELIDLPPMTDPESRATVDVLTSVFAPASFTDEILRSLVICRITNLSLEHGNSDGSCLAYVWLGMILGPHFGDYRAGFRFGNLGLDLVEKGGRDGFKARVYLCFGGFVLPWTRHMVSGLRLVRRAFDTANKMGGLTCGRYSTIVITSLLATGEPLGEVQREAENGLEFARKVRFGPAIDVITTQLELIRTLRGLTPSFSSFNEADFNESSFEQHLEAHPTLATGACWYWIRKLQARVYTGDYVSAIEAALRAQPFVWTSQSCFEVAEYHFYGALARAGRYDSASADEKPQHMEALVIHHKQLEVWAENCPENFENRAALVGAEIARLQGRELDAELLYEKAILSAHANGFVHNEALANELAARFYRARGLNKIALTYLQDARYYYIRWGATAKVRQLDELYPDLKEKEPVQRSASTIDAPVEHLDLAAVIKVSQAVSGEIVLEKLIDAIMRTAIEHAGAERGLLILPVGAEQRIVAEATTSGDTIIVCSRDASIGDGMMPESIVQYVGRTHESVILDDASVQNPFSADAYISRRHPRSILCLPLVNQAKLIGALYLENDLAPHVFTPTRIGVLKLLASQAAISLENARLYADLEEREAMIRRADEALRSSEHRFRLVVETIPGLVAIMTPAGEVEHVNRQVLEYFGRTLEELKRWGTIDAVHPDDLPRVIGDWTSAVATGHPYETEHRIRRADGAYRWFQCRGLPQRDADGRIVRWYNLLTDIEERKQAEEKLRKSEAYLSEAQRLSHTGTAGWDIASREIYWSRETYRIFELEPTTQVTAETILERTHPEDRSAVLEVFERVSRERTDINLEHRLLMPDGRIKYLHVVAHPSKDRSGRLEMVGAVTDITERKRGTEEMQKLASLVENSTDFIGIASLQGEVLFVNATGQAIVGLAGNEQVQGTKIPDYVAEQDLGRFNRDVLPSVFKNGHWEGETLFRHFKTGASIPMWQHVFFITDEGSGRRLALATISRDITERKRAEDELRRSEEFLLAAQSISKTGSWRHDIRSGAVIVSPEIYRMWGITPHEDASVAELYFARLHPEDRQRVQQLFERCEGEKTVFDTGARILLPDGTIKHVHSIGHPVLNESGDLIEFIGTTIDVTEQWKARVELEKAFEEIKHLKDRLHDENLALREQIDQAFMFEEIVGSSPALQAVLTSVVKVAPTDSTVLISGETGTGKELIARAIHKRSRRAEQAFISVNCASIPSSLIASELFGHEKGAFTGALQQRQGRFELAHSGTIFLDEIGELPAETQIALLRVLQERQFERVGGNKIIPADVRVITATNRDLSAAIAAGTFRSDLFYRLNVFPIEVPPLRKRKEDIPMLVEYFVGRFAEKLGKQIGKIDKKTLELCERYQWPGNIRELQNIVERSVILCSGNTFWIDESWLSVQLPRRAVASLPLGETLQNQEKEIIEAALADSRGRVAGPNGAALKLGIPRSTLDRKIQQLKIKKHKFTSKP